MTLPEQLQLDFSTTEKQASDTPPAVAQVLRLAEYRTARDARRMSGVYAAIFDSIKHIEVRRRQTPPVAADSTSR